MEEAKKVLQAPEKKIDLEKYHDTDGLTIKKLDRSYWLLKHRNGLKMIAYVSLMIVIFLTFGSLVCTIGEYVIIGRTRAQRMIADMSQQNFPSGELLDSLKARELVVPTLIKMKRGSMQDMLIKIENPNKNYLSRFTYDVIDSAGKTIGPYNDFIYPGQTKYLLADSISSKSNIENFEFTRVDWERIDRKKIPDWDAYVAERIDFAIENKKFTPAYTSSLSEKLKLSTVEFDVTNNSAYNYRDAKFLIVLHNNGGILSAGVYVADEFRSLETKHVNITWAEGITQSDTIEVYPYVDVLKNTSSYLY